VIALKVEVALVLSVDLDIKGSENQRQGEKQGCDN
jgi:hypothetical protein